MEIIKKEKTWAWKFRHTDGLQYGNWYEYKGETDEELSALAEKARLRTIKSIENNKQTLHT